MIILSGNSPLFNDLVGNTIAIITLILMLVSAVGVIYYFMTGKVSWVDQLPGWIIPLLAIMGSLIASYLSFIEFSDSTPFCGPIGDCGNVQNSSYATLFGVIPVGLLGLMGYILILILWLVARISGTRLRNLIEFGIWVLAWFGLLFSIYLTFLEPFVIGATCMWCVSSAIIMTLLLWVSTSKAKKYWISISEEDQQETD